MAMAMKALALTIVMALTAVAARAYAAAPGPAVGAGPVRPKKTVIDLSGSVIEGELVKPEGSYVVARKMSRFSTLITVRQSFAPELLASPDRL